MRVVTAQPLHNLRCLNTCYPQMRLCNPTSFKHLRHTPATNTSGKTVNVGALCLKHDRNGQCPQAPSRSCSLAARRCRLAQYPFRQAHLLLNPGNCQVCMSRILPRRDDSRFLEKTKRDERAMFKHILGRRGFPRVACVCVEVEYKNRLGVERQASTTAFSSISNRASIQY